MKGQTTSHKTMIYPPRPHFRSKPPIITLLTDFGLEDVYVGVMKGVISTIHPLAPIIDLTHQVPPQNISVGSFQLGNAYPTFPPGTIHVAVVDPEVGSDRRAVAVQMPSGILVGPDNGLFSHVLTQENAITAIELTNKLFWALEQPSNTFHGRDIFAPVAAHLARGIPLQSIGPAITIPSLTTLPTISSWQATDNGGIGKIQAIDHFGNLITNIPAHKIKKHNWSLQIGQHFILSATSYATTEAHPTLRALIGSHGWLEIALPNGNAHLVLHCYLGDTVQLHLHC